MHLLDVVLAKYIEGTDKVWSVPGEFESAELESDPVPGGKDPLRGDLQPGDGDVRTERTQPLCPLNRRGVRGTISDVEGQRGLCPPHDLPDTRFMHHPPVASTEPVPVSGATGGHTDGPTTAGGEIRC